MLFVNNHDFNFSEDDGDNLKEAEEKLLELENTKWLSIAKELHQEDPYRFLRAFSPGITT